MSVLSSRVLVLNKSWVAFDIWTLEHAITSLFKTNVDGTPKARIVNIADFSLYNWDAWAALEPEEGDKLIRSVSRGFKVPEVIVLSGYNKYPKPRLNFSRKSMNRLYKQRCQYCGKRFTTDELTIDHVIPKSQGGKTTWENCVLCCVGCNSYKANRTPHEARMKLLCGEPQKPTSKLFNVGKVRCKSWENFISEVYWNGDIGED